MAGDVFYIAYRVFYWALIAGSFITAFIQSYKIINPYYKVFRSLPPGSQKYIARTGSRYFLRYLFTNLKSERILIVIIFILVTLLITLNLLIWLLPA
jgi:hypothetical protein